MDEMDRCHSYAWAASQASEVARERGRDACVVNLRARATRAGTGEGEPACCLAAAIDTVPTLVAEYGPDAVAVIALVHPDGTTEPTTGENRPAPAG